MGTAYLAVAGVAVAANGFSGLVALVQPDWALRRLRPGMAVLGIPESWGRFPIGFLKTLGAVGLLAGLLVPVIGPVIFLAAAIGLVAFWVCAVFSHVRVSDWSGCVGAGGFLALAIATLTLGLAA